MKMNKKLRCALAVILSVMIAATLFAGGFFTSLAVRGKSSTTYDWAVKTIKDNYYEDLSEGDILNAALKGVASQCLDKYSEFYTAEEYSAAKSSNAGNKLGIGFSHNFIPSGTYGGGGVYITKVVGNSPAFKSGLKVGEFVLGARLGSQEFTFSTQAQFDAFLSARENGEEFTFITDRGETLPMMRAEYVASYCTMATATSRWDISYDSAGGHTIKSEGGISCLPQGAAYIRLDQFYGNAAAEMATLMSEFNAEGCTSLILDLRQNGGGYVDVMSDISGIFLGQLQNAYANSMVAVYKNGNRDCFKVRYKYGRDSLLPAGVKVSVLADSGTASASEALIGVLVSNGVIDYGNIYLSDFSENYLRATGTAAKNCRTYGKGIMQTTIENYATGEAVKLTTAKIYWPNGNCIHGTGLMGEPVGGACKTVATDWCFTYGDTQLADAVALIYG